MARVARIPITNVYADGAYTGLILVGPDMRPMNVLLDSGSSMLALDGRKYRPDKAGGDRTTKFAQYSSYSDGSFWAGGVIKTMVSVADPDSPMTAKGINVSLATDATSDMFGRTDGILGLAYAALDEAWEMPKDTTEKQYSSTKVRAGRYTQITPYLTQLRAKGVVSDKFAFYTRRSWIHRGGGANDPLNRGWMILGGGEECRDLYTGPFQTARVLAEQWYNTNLKAIVVGDTPPLSVHQRPPNGYPSNSIVDSGTTSIDLGPLLLKALFSRFTPDQQALLKADDPAQGSGGAHGRSQAQILAAAHLHPAGLEEGCRAEGEPAGLLAGQRAQARDGLPRHLPGRAGLCDPRPAADEWLLHDLRRRGRQ